MTLQLQKLHGIALSRYSARIFNSKNQESSAIASAIAIARCAFAT
jgi:hypothetical protein